MSEKNLTTSNAAVSHPREATRSGERYISPPVDIFETDDGLTLVADVPGLDDKSLEINVDKGTCFFLDCQWWYSLAPSPIALPLSSLPKGDSHQVRPAMKSQE